MGKLTLTILFTLLTLIQLMSSLEYQRTMLMDSWKMEILDTVASPQASTLKGKIYNVTLPTNLHLDLLANQAIPDPFQGDNYPKVQWVSETTIKYTHQFSIKPQILALENHELTFQGIDTYANVTLNGHLIQSTENAFRRYTVPVKHLLLAQSNKLEVTILPSSYRDDPMQQTNKMPFKYAHTRKPCYQYSSDQTPYLNTLGIWKPVYVDSFNNVRVDYVWVRNKLVSDPKAILNFAIVLDIPEGLPEETPKAKTKSKQTTNQYWIKVYENETEIGSSKVSDKEVYLNVEIDKPKLWWPRGAGNPYVYQFKVKLFKEKEQVDERRVPFGIRTVSLNTAQQKFQVTVNGYPIYCKGANYVPPDMLYSRLDNPKFSGGVSREDLLKAAADSNFNMLRIWGGGQYESDQFLELASNLGIMIFYDFMFSNSIYPSDQAFLSNVEEEVKQQVRRARNYPAVVLWCGNNEILQGIEDKGWNSQKYTEDYTRLFEKLIRKVVEIEAPYTPYIPTSPLNGVGNTKFYLGGDFHYWGVWGTGSPFQSYEQSVGPFNSEFGTQGFPVWETIQSFTTPADYTYDSPVLLKHQRHGKGFSILRKYMNQYMKKAGSFELDVYQSGLLQAYAFELAIIAQRTAKPKSYGTLYWQFNDAWPGISWSSIDYYGRWKPLQFMAKRMYPDLAVFCKKNGTIMAVNDKLQPVEVTINIELIAFSGMIMFTKSSKIKLDEQKAQMIEFIGPLVKGNEAIVVAYCQLLVGQVQVMHSTTFFKNFKDLNLPPASMTVHYDTELNMIELSTSMVIKSLYISNTKEYLQLSDNYFDLVPEHPMRVKVLNKKPLGELKEGMQYMSYAQIEGGKLIVNQKIAE